MNFIDLLHKRLIISAFTLLICSFSNAQKLLSQNISVNAYHQPLSNVLKDIGRQGNFYFSYSNNIIHDDSIVTINAHNKTVGQVLDILFNGSCQYKEASNHIILQPLTKERLYTITGFVKDEKTGEKISNASIYEQQELVSSLTDDNGYFRLKLRNKNKYATASITISRENYIDTSILVLPGYDRELDVHIKPITLVLLDTVIITQHSQVEKTWIGRLFLSSKQSFQGINLDKFIIKKPFQFSLVPGLSTHGKLSSQMTNKFSLNILGGYTAGVNGFELGGFNITRKSAKYAQVGGLFNIVGGSVVGAQVSGLYNHVMDSVQGVQAAGLVNISKKHIAGAQVSGVYNHLSDSIDGIQVGGVANYVKTGTKGAQVAGIDNISVKEVKGIQLSGVSNFTQNIEGAQIAGVNNYSKKANGLQLAGVVNYSKEVKGMQLSGVFNYAKKVDGFQLGLVNYADTSSGCSLGLINVIKKGYHKLSISTNEVMNVNVAYKGGTRQFYTIVFGALNVVSGNSNAYSIGYGIGSEFKLSNTLAITTELTAQNLYLGDWNKLPFLYRIQPDLNVKLSKKLSLFAGPAFSVYYSTQTSHVSGYKSDIPGSDYHSIFIAKNYTGWFGWHVGLNLF